MKPPRLFLKIFLWFWSTLIITSLSVALSVRVWHARISAGWHWRWMVALFASAFVCYLLTRYLTRPILQLRHATHQLAAGHLHTRALGVERRGDELGDLVRDFNIMAARIDELVSRQRQLTYDISHELRSPLARLNVALDLARERKGADPAFDHMQRDLELLDEMIGRLLTIARLDAAATPLPMTALDLSELVAQIVHNAGFEACQRKVDVTLAADPSCTVTANAELLSSAIENVIRNAVHYTDPGTTVAVTLRFDYGNLHSRITLSVRDAGPGVPPGDLARIFQPFYRTTEARDRKSGGAGLGLAIAERVMRAHGGSVRAANLEPHGLEILLTLPALQPDTARP